MKIIRQILWATVTTVLLAGCTEDGDTIDPMPDGSLTLRKIVGRYYGNRNFRVGMSEPYGYLAATDSIARVRQNIYYSEFALGVSAEKFRQEVTAPTGDSRMWNSGEYRFLIDESRNQKQEVLPEAPLGPRCSEWAGSDERTPEELEALLLHYVGTLCTDIQLNNDTVHSLILAEDFIGGEAANPWLQLGVETGDAGGVEIEYPRYLSVALTCAAGYAPSIKQLIAQQSETLGDDVWGPVKSTVLALKSNGCKIDGICWKAVIPLGWEQDPDNRKNLLRLIDWCYLNNVEFHVTHLMVAVSEGTSVEDVDRVEETRDAQAATYAAVVEVVTSRAGRGARSLSFGTLNGSFSGGVTYAGLYDGDLLPAPAYEAVKQVLIQTAKK